MQIVDLNETKNDSILAGIAKAEQKPLIPVGYVPIALSTKGKVGAPALFHVRNFSTKDAMSLALTEESELPERMIALLSSLIYEKDVDPRNFHENEVVETLVNLYASFFAPVLTSVEFPVIEEDFEYLRATLPVEEAEEKIRSLKEGRWVPETEIDILKDVDVYELSPDFNSVATIRYKKTGFSVAFGMPKYGDILIVKRWLAENYDEKERRFASIKQLVDVRDKMLAKYEEGASIDLNRLPTVDARVEEEYNNLQIEKTAALVDVIRALHLVGFDGRDVSAEPLSERIKLVQDPRIDISVAKKLDNYFDSLQFGIKPEVRMRNPITNQICSRRFSFRLVDIFQAIQLSEADEYDIVYSNEFKPEQD